MEKINLILHLEQVKKKFIHSDLHLEQVKKKLPK
jgi:hypothetical protein